MKVQKFQSEHEYQKEVALIQLNQQLIQKVSKENLISFSQERPRQRPSQNKIPVQVFRVVLMEDKSLWCPELSRKLPVNNSGAIDLDKLAHEIRRDPEFFSLNRHQQLMNK